MKIGIASDHQGVKVKEKIIKYLEKNYEVINLGPDSDKSVDYPDYAKLLTSSLINKEIDMGIIICKTGIGMSIACNRVKGIRCAKVEYANEAKLTRMHNDANILALRSTMPLYKMKKIIKYFLTTPFSNEERHVRRINKIEEMGK